jgi:ubiquinone biosynthesis protein
MVTLIRYGFGGLVAEMHLLPYLSFVQRIFVKRRKAALSIPVRIRLVLEELGPTFVKLGQIASTRADILPAEWIEEFKKLQDMVKPLPFSEVKRVVEASLKSTIEERFASFEETPAAAASIAQVHYAVLKGGDEVAVKVKRPGIDATISADISVMRMLAQLLIKYVPASRRYRPIEVVGEFERVIGNEQDLRVEGVAANRFAKLFAGDETVQIPRVYWELSSEEVLTMERIYGTPIDEVETLKSKGIDIKKAAIRGLEAFFKQVFEFGVFHADLHPGNIFIRDDGVIIYLDFGIVGYIDKDLRRYLASILHSLVRKDYHKMALVHREMGLIDEDVDIHEFEEALRAMAEPIHGNTLEQINISELLAKLLATARRFDMLLQPDLLLLQKSMVIIEGVGRQLYPEINIWEVAGPLVSRWVIKERLSPGSLAGKGREGLEGFIGAACSIPINVNKVLSRTLRDALKIGFVHHGLEPVVDEFSMVGRRIAGGLVTGALVVGAAIMAASPEGHAAFLGLPLLGWGALVVALIVGVKTIGRGRG